MIISQNFEIRKGFQTNTHDESFRTTRWKLNRETIKTNVFVVVSKNRRTRGRMRDAVRSFVFTREFSEGLIIRTEEGEGEEEESFLLFTQRLSRQLFTFIFSLGGGAIFVNSQLQRRRRRRGRAIHALSLFLSSVSSSRFISQQFDSCRVCRNSPLLL